MRDKTNTILELQKLVCKFRDKRGWKKYHTPRNLATSISLESSELLEIFQWDLDAGGKRQLSDSGMVNIEQELSDIIIFSLFLASILKIDLSKAVVKKIKHNRKKYPTRYFNKNNQDQEYYSKVKRDYREKK